MPPTASSVALERSGALPEAALDQRAVPGDLASDVHVVRAVLGARLEYLGKRYAVASDATSLLLLRDAAQFVDNEIDCPPTHPALPILTAPKPPAPPASPVGCHR